MSETYIRLVDDSNNTGKKVRVLENTISGNVVEQQVVSLADSSGNLLEGTTQGLPVKVLQAAVSTANLSGTGQLAIACSGYASVLFGLSGTYQGILTFEGSDDGGSNYRYAVDAVRVGFDAAENVTAALTNTTRGWWINCEGLTHIQARVSTYTSGTLALRGTVSAAPFTGITLVSGTIAAGTTDSGAPVKVGGVYNTSLPTYTNGQRGDFQIDASGRQLVQSSGDIAAAATDSGNPVKVGGKMNTTLPTYTNGQRGDAQIDANGLLRSLIYPTATTTTITPTMDTSAYTGGDVWFDTTTIGALARANGGTIILDTITILDEDDQTAAALTIYFLDTNTSLGTINGAPSISDANARKILGWIAIASGDWVDVGGAKVACKTGLNLTLTADAASATLYMAATCGGTPTQTATGIKIKLGYRVA